MKKYYWYSKHFKDVATHEVDTVAETETIVIDLQAIKQGAEATAKESFDKGFEAGIASELSKAKNTNGAGESLKQIDRMARQIEEAHAALRRRNTEIGQMSARIAELQNKIEMVKNQTEREARAEAWHEGWKHDAEFQSAFGQFCRDRNCNPYKKDAK